MFRKAVILCLSYYTLAIVVSGCCNCPELPVRYFRWSGVSLKNFSHAYSADSIVYPVYDTSVDFRYRNYTLGVMMEHVLLTSNCRSRNYLLNEADACKCSPQAYSTSRPVIDVRVFTVNNYDSQHPSGTEITDRFGSRSYVGGNPKGIGPLELPLNQMHFDFDVPHYPLELYMAKRPDSGTIQQFRVRVTLQDSTSFTGLTSVLEF